MRTRTKPSDSGTVPELMLPFAVNGFDQWSRYIHAQQELFRQTDELLRLARGNFENAVACNAKLASDLAGWKSPQESATICARWAQGQFERLSSNGQDMTHLWMTMMQATASNGVAALQRSNGSAAREHSTSDKEVR